MTTEVFAHFSGRKVGFFKAVKWQKDAMALWSLNVGLWTSVFGLCVVLAHTKDKDQRPKTKDLLRNFREAVAESVDDEFQAVRDVQLGKD